MIHSSHARRVARCSLGALAFLVALTPAPSRAEERAMTLEEVVETALTHNPDMTSARDEVAAAIAGQRAMRGNFGPKLRAEANVMRWDKKLDFAFEFPPGSLPFEIDIPPMTVRDPTTTQISLTFIQPVGALWGIYEGYKVKELGVDVARVRRESARRNTAFQATESFYRVLQTMRLADVARLSVESLEAQVTRARSFYKHGLVNHNDLLRAELGLAAARQRHIQAKGTVTLAQGKLALTMGIEPDVLVVPKGAPDDAPPAETMAIGEAERRALQSRVEIREIDAVIRQADRGVRYARSKMLPSVNLLANYQHNTGSTFSPKDSGWVGVFLQWDFWEWGATYYGIGEAQARQRQALAARAKVRDGLRLDARAAWITQATAAEALAVAKGAVASAEENFRLETRRYEAHTNTSFDVIDAESQLTQARATMLTALYDYTIARANLGRAIGDDIVGSRARPARRDAPRDTRDTKDTKDAKDAKDARSEGSHAAR
ncbi:MAG: TolC family protein [Deltaproteobacteria bacterium]|nr:TolC family protein [Deltaproteobacteria bacterium]